MSSNRELADFRTAVEEQCTRFSRNFRDGNIERLVDEFYAPDPRMIAPDAPLIRGRDGVKAVFKSMQQSGVKEVLLEPLELRVSGDCGHEIGKATLSAGPDRIRQAARYLVVWRKTGEGWRVEADMFSVGPI